MEQKKGTLFICATPIGNLSDASFRLVETLKNADLIAAEDTRTAGKLLKKYGIRNKNLTSYHDFSHKEKIEKICKALTGGTDVALISESGTPAIQDPGYKLIRECIKRGLPITVIPGPNAGLAALVLSGFPTDNFLFLGFLPKARGKRKKKLAEVKNLPYTLIIYESPNRLEKLLADMQEVIGSRNICMLREITKMYEESIRGSIEKVQERIKGKKIKGEIVVVAEGFKEELITNYTEEELARELVKLISQGISKKTAIKILLSKYDINRQKLYNISTKI
ncbi:MAG: 16S rRNA (cytidine(1402)-2'-O)-methyltransferase [Actinomycetota bacterium]